MGRFILGRFSSRDCNAQKQREVISLSKGDGHSRRRKQQNALLSY